MQIPQVIHYVWLGDEKTPTVNSVISSWKKKAKDFKIKEWNEKDLEPLAQSNAFFRDALDDKNYSYASDVARLFILKNYGGLYLDTDEILLTNPSKIIQNRELVYGIQEPAKEFILTAFIAAVPGQTEIAKMLEFYNGLDYEKNSLIPNSEFFGPIIFKKYKLLHIPKTQEKNNKKIVFYAPNVLYQPSFHSIAIHIGMKAWGTKTRHDKFRINARKHLHNRFEAGMFRIINDIARKVIPDSTYGGGLNNDK